jgi:two-component system chemotaxis response regulator CheY
MSDEKKTPYDGVKVLVVEDEVHTRTMIKGMLRQIGIYSTLEAADGKAGLTEIARTRPTLVLCDIHMKPVDGRQFLKMVRATKVDWVRNIPVIFLTADANPEMVKLARELQVDGYLVKPVNVTDLKARIDLVLKNVDRSAKAQGL